MVFIAGDVFAVGDGFIDGEAFGVGEVIAASSPCTSGCLILSRR